MRSLSRAVLKASTKTATSSSWLLLVSFTIDDNTVRIVDNPEDIVFAGNTYTAANIGIGTAQESSDGQITTWSIIVDDISRLVAPTIEAYDGAIGAVVELVVVNSKLLAENYVALTRTFTVKGTSIEGDRITLTLSGGNLLVKRCPRYRYQALHCKWRAGTVECGQPNPCNRTYANCVSNANSARFGGFISLRSGTLRYV